MAYNKLTQTLIDKFVDELKLHVQNRCNALNIGFPLNIGPLSRTFSLREIYKKVGISHTTFY